MGLFDLFDNDNNKRRRRGGGLDDLVDDFGASLGAGLGTALGSALNSAIKPAVNNIGNSVASSIKENAGTATKSMVSIAESQKKIADKKETTSFEYYDVCPYCGAPRDGERDECEYCGTSLVKSTQTKIE
jgi:hypothetical protein